MSTDRSAPADALVAAIARRLTEAGETVAIAETSAGGGACRRVTAVAGSSTWFLGGVVAYSNYAKERWLGVTPSALQTAGAVSAAAALDLARGARRSLGSTWGLAETGIAGPQSGRRSAKPAGLAYLAVVGEVDGRHHEWVREHRTGADDRQANQAEFAEALLRFFRDCLEGQGGR